MFLRFLLYILYLFIPIVVVFLTLLAMNISSNKQTDISVTLSSKDLINPNYIYYSEPKDIIHKYPYYTTDEIFHVMSINDYLETNDSLKFDLESFCNLDFVFFKKEIKKKSFDEFIVSISLLNNNETIINKAESCIDLFIDNLNEILFFRFSKERIIERIDYNTNVLNLILKSEFLIDMEEYYSETRAQIIINTLNIVEQDIYKALEDLTKLKKNLKNPSEEYNILKKLLESLNKQEDILLSFNNGLSFSEDLSFTTNELHVSNEVYYKYILNTLKSLKVSIIDDQVTLKINDVKIDKEIDEKYSLITPGFILFILLLSSLIIVIIELLYRKIR